MTQPTEATATRTATRKRSVRSFHAVDSHTEGMPTRVVTDGVGTLPGSTMAERRQWFIENADDLRRLLMDEPRGHAAMSGAILQQPTRPDADWGVLFIEVSGCLPLCGHGTIGVATVLVETGMVPVVEPVTTVRLDTPAGLVLAEVEVRGGVAESVTFSGVASFSHELDATVDVPGIGSVRCDLAYGGNFYAIVDAEQLALRLDKAESRGLIDAGLAVMAAVDEQCRPQHPERPEIQGCRHVQVVGPGSTARHSRHAMVIHPGWFDRSPCGTGTAARMAQLHARGQLRLCDDFVNESFIGSRFTGRLVGETRVGGRPAVVPTITGRAWLTGIGDYLLDPTDPFPAGFRL